ncbi:hypothetical protein ACH4Q6_25130 [Streptomyces lydicus]|uniref:hypothetical protein n=1 Tax=Streptomyces lydicus TaxID=47763 RepID=UPI00378B70AF
MARRLSRRALTMRDAHLAAERLQQRGWKVLKVLPETIVLMSGQWLVALTAAPLPDTLRGRLAPYKGVLVLMLTGKQCARS